MFKIFLAYWIVTNIYNNFFKKGDPKNDFYNQIEDNTQFVRVTIFIQRILNFKFLIVKMKKYFYGKKKI